MAALSLYSSLSLSLASDTRIIRTHSALRARAWRRALSFLLSFDARLHGPLSPHRPRARLRRPLRHLCLSEDSLRNHSRLRPTCNADARSGCPRSPFTLPRSSTSPSVRHFFQHLSTSFFSARALFVLSPPVVSRRRRDRA